MMAASTSMRVGHTPAIGNAVSREATTAEPGDFLALLAAATAGAEPDPDSVVASDGTELLETSGDAAPEALAQLLPGLFASLTSAAAPGDGEQESDLLDGGTAFDADAATPQALLTVDVLPLVQEADALALRGELLDQLAAELTAGAAVREPARDVLQQLAQPLFGTAAESAPGSRVPPGAELAGIAAAPGGPAAPASLSTAAPAVAMEQAVRTGVGTPRWADELGSRLVMMSTRGQHEGSLTLAPEHLGPLEVRISMNQNTAHVWFGAQHADTRAALAEAMPRLRELFTEAGLSLGQSGVSQETPRRHDSHAAAGHSSIDGVSEIDQARVAPAVARHIGSALVDLYA